MAKYTMKICDGFRLIHQNGVEEYQVFQDIFTDAFGWDLENDDMAKKCYDAVFRKVFCEGRVDLTEWAHGTCIIEVIPVKDPKWELVEE